MSLYVLKIWTILYFILQTNCKWIGSEIRESRAFKGGDCTFGARVRTTAGDRSCCIPGTAGAERVKPSLRPVTRTPAFCCRSNLWLLLVTVSVHVHMCVFLSCWRVALWFALLPVKNRKGSLVTVRFCFLLLWTLHFSRTPSISVMIRHWSWIFTGRRRRTHSPQCSDKLKTFLLFFTMFLPQ